MMKSVKPEIRVGSRGWNFDQWGGDFYPDDLPEDWRFSYYSNEFQAMLVPMNYLKQFSLDDWREWIDDTSKDYWFFVEISESDTWEDIEPYLQVFSDKLKGIVVSVEKLDSVDSLASLINKSKRVAPVTLTRTGTTISDQDMVTLQSCYEVNECWNGSGESPNWGYAESSAILLRSSEDDNSPEIIRHLVENGLEHAGRRESLAIIFDGTAPKISDMNNARTISELLA